MRAKLRAAAAAVKRFCKASRRAALWLLAFLLTLLPAVYMNNIYGYLPILTLLIVSLLSLGYLAVLGRSVGAQDRSLLSSCMRGTAMEFRVEVENRCLLACPRVELSFFMTDLYGGRDGGTSTVITLAPREKRVFTFDARFDHLGRYSVGLDKVTVFGPLGVLSRTLPGGAEHIVEVTPRIWELESLNLSQQVTTEDSRARTSSTLDGADYTGVREYAVGDPIKNIHWKLSAHTEGFLTRQMETFGSTGVTVILDLCAPDCTGETGMCLYDALVETAAAVCNRAISRGLENDLNFFDRRGAEQRLEVRDSAQFDSLPSLLPPLVRRAEDYPVEQLLIRSGRALYARSNVVLCTSRVSESTVKLLGDIKLGRRTPALFFVLPRDAYGRERDALLQPLHLLDELGISYFVLTSAEELQ